MSFSVCSYLLCNSIAIIIALRQLAISASMQQQQHPISDLFPNQCGERCGEFQVPFPFHLNSSCGSASDAFRLTCLNATSLFLNIDSKAYRIIQFFSDGVLVDFPGVASCRQYYDVNSFGFKGDDYLSISLDNVISLYECEDSSLCRQQCEKMVLPDCDAATANSSSTCCYPLRDRGMWRVGDGFSKFSEFGCRGFTSWAVFDDTAKSGRRGVKLEWAIPRNSSKPVCAQNARIVDATTIKAGMRCACQKGFVGDGFAQGVGCLKSCITDGEGHQIYGADHSYIRRHAKTKVVIQAGVLAPAVILVSLVAIYCQLRRPRESRDTDPAHFQSSISFRKASRMRLFTYGELEEATKGFEDGQKLVDGINGTVHAGVLGDGSLVAVQKIQCQGEQDLVRILARLESLFMVSHRNIARLLGCCLESRYTPLVVYELPANGTLEEHLAEGGDGKVGLDWNKRLNVAAETASALAYLQYGVSPPIYHHDLKSGSIFLDQNYSVKLSTFGLSNCRIEDGARLRGRDSSEGSQIQTSDVYDLGVVLLEIIAGSRLGDLPTVALTKIRSGKLEEIVDPALYYHEQPLVWREQIETFADLATRCLMFGGTGDDSLGMIDVSRELVQMKENMDGVNRRRPALEETFSNSSLLQMISMSPDSVYMT